MKAVILIDGLKNRIREESHLKPKPMIQINNMQRDGKQLEI